MVRHCKQCDKDIGFFSPITSCNRCNGQLCSSCLDSLYSELGIPEDANQGVRLKEFTNRNLSLGKYMESVLHERLRHPGIILPFCKECIQYLKQNILAYYEKVGRYEEAAIFCEEFGMIDEAKRERDKTRLTTQTVKNINIDLNQLLEKLSQGGFVIPYKCQSCGASLKIDKDSKAEGLKFCSYCGSAMNIDAVFNLLSDTLG